MRYTSKEFLSTSPYESGSIVTMVETARVKDMCSYTLKGDPMINAKITLRACYGEPLELDFDVRGHKGFAKRLAKLEKLQDELEKFKTHLVNGWENHLKNFEHAKSLQEKDK